MNHFRSDAWDKARAEKRSGAHIIALDLSELKTQLAGPAASTPTAEQAYERQGALALLNEVYRRLEREHQEHGKTELFAALRPALTESHVWITLAHERNRQKPYRSRTETPGGSRLGRDRIETTGGIGAFLQTDH